MTLPVFITVIADHDKPQPSGCLLEMGWEKNISDYLKNMCSYLGIEDADVTFLCNTVVFDGEELHASYYQSLLSQVRDMLDAL